MTTFTRDPLWHFVKCLFLYDERLARNVLLSFVSTNMEKEAGISQLVYRLGYGLDGRGDGLRFPAGARDISLLHKVQNAMRSIKPLVQQVPGSFSLRVKRHGREADHSPPSSAEVKNGGAIPPPPHTSSWRGN
jgi:hypothetical protein